MTGRRGYQCADGPLAGAIVTVDDDSGAGSLWIVQGPEDSHHVYRFCGDRFEFVEPDFSDAINAPHELPEVDSW